MRLIALEDSRAVRSARWRHRSVAFLDRDGVINRNLEPFVMSKADVDLLPGTAGQIGAIARAGYAVVIVTNQAGVGLGALSLRMALDVHRRVVHELAAAGAPITASYLCPHAPTSRCECRKPQPGMLLHALRRLNATADSAFLIGDKESDVQAAHAAGLRGYQVATSLQTSAAHGIHDPWRVDWSLPPGLPSAPTRRHGQAE